MTNRILISLGEDVTEQAKMIGNLPMTIPYKSYLELRGECVVSWDNFHKINERLDEYLAVLEKGE